MTGTWQYQGPFPTFLLDQLKSRIDGEDLSDLQDEGEDDQNDDVNEVHNVYVREVAQVIGARMSTIFQVFHCAVIHELGGNEAVSERKWNQDVLDRFAKDVDWPAFRAKFPAAYEIFKTRIYFESIQSRVVRDYPFRGKVGLVWTLDGPMNSRDIVIASPNYEACDAVMAFLSSDVGALATPRLERIFSPEEEVFQPFFAFLSSAFPTVINDARIQPQFFQAFQYFEGGDFTHCVGALGLVGEDYLTQVYETLLRKPIPKGLTLGQIYDGLHDQLRQRLHPAPQKLVPVDEVYELSKRAEAIDLEADVDAFKRSLAQALREIANTIKSDRKYFDHRIRELQSIDTRLSIFPVLIRENLADLIRFRNAAAHKTRIPIGSYEALRALYCLTSFVMWWLRERTSIDWRKEADEILKDLVERNSK